MPFQSNDTHLLRAPLATWKAACSGHRRGNAEAHHHPQRDDPPPLRLVPALSACGGSMNPRRMRAGQQSPPCEPSAASVGRGPRAGGRLPADAARGEASFLLTESITPARRLGSLGLGLCCRSRSGLPRLRARLERASPAKTPFPPNL